MKNTCFAAVVLFAVLFAASVRAEGDTKMTTSLNAGLTLTDGNSETLLGNAGIVTEGEKASLGSVRAGAEFNYGESKVNDGDKETTLNNAKLFGNAKKTITDRAYGYLDGNLFHDDIANISYRLTIGPGAGYYLIKNDRMSFSAEAGPSYVWEKVAGETGDHLALRLSDRFDWAFSETAKCWQSAEFLPQVDDVENYLLNVEVGVEAAMTSRMNLRLVLQDMYNSQPAAGKKHNDLTLIAGVGIKL